MNVELNPQAQVVQAPRPVAWRNRVDGDRAVNILRRIARRTGNTFDQVAATFEVLLDDEQKTPYHPIFAKLLEQILPAQAKAEELVQELVGHQPQEPEIIKINIPTGKAKLAAAATQALIKQRADKEAAAKEAVAKLVGG